MGEGAPSAPARFRPRVAITAGDPNGIGPEVVLKCLEDARLRRILRPVVIGSPEVLREHARLLGMDELESTASVPSDSPEDSSVVILDPAPEERCPVTLGEVRPEAGRLAMQSVKMAVNLCLEGDCDAMVTAPISKEAIALAGHDAPGHTEFIARMTGGRPLMMMVADDFRVGLLTAHVPLREVSALVTEDAVLDYLTRFAASLRSDFDKGRPRIAVLGLNPHAGDGGVLGTEEQTAIAPAIRRACHEGIAASGPFAADGFFAASGHTLYDGVLAMYHDQGLVPFKALAFENGVNFTAGLPIVRTSPDHGTAYDIAGKGKASPASLRSALYLAVDIAKRRRRMIDG